MAYTLVFDLEHTYDAGTSGITLPVILSAGQNEVRLNAKIDTGATYCIFQRHYGEALGLDIESGEKQTLKTATGTFIAYGHSLSLAVYDLQFDIVAYFASHYEFERDVLGRHGWLDRVKIAIIDYEGKLYLSKYDTPS